ncbi:hypothetical protein CBL_12640 [Carabus blaptoides fortunei]
MTSLFAEIESIDDEDEISFVYQMLMNITSVQILMDDGLPNLICKSCIESANTALKFRSMCERSEALIQTYITHMRIKDEISTNRESDEVIEEEVTYEAIDDNGEFKSVVSDNNVTKTLNNEEVLDETTEIDLSHDESKDGSKTVEDNITNSPQVSERKEKVSSESVRNRVIIKKLKNTTASYGKVQIIENNQTSELLPIPQEVLVNPDIALSDGEDTVIKLKFILYFNVGSYSKIT